MGGSIKVPEGSIEGSIEGSRRFHRRFWKVPEGSRGFYTRFYRFDHDAEAAAEVTGAATSSFDCPDSSARLAASLPR